MYVNISYTCCDAFDWQHYRGYAAQYGILRYGSEVGSAASLLRRGTMAAEGVAVATDGYDSVGQFNLSQRPVTWYVEGDGLCRSSGSHCVLVFYAVSHCYTVGG